MTFDSRITFTRASTATYYNVSGVLSSAATNVARLDYDPVTHVAKGFLIEQQMLNEAVSSEAFDNINWTKTGCTVTANNIAAPDGATTADRITSSATTSTVEQILGASGSFYAHSVFAKKGTCNWIYLVGQATDTPRVWFNLDTGVKGTAGAGFVSTGIQDVGGGWYRCWFVDAVAGGLENIVIGLANADNSTTVTVGLTVYLWGAQVESNTNFVSSYMPTAVGATATRSADVATMTSTNFSSWYNASAGTFVADFVLLAASGTRGIISADNATTAEQILLYSSGTDPKAKVRDGSADQADLDVGTVAASTTYKLGVSFAANDIAACLNGGTVGTNTSATMPTPTQLRIGFDGGGASAYLNGWLRRVRFYNVAKSDADLQTLTT
jgi:hypothetical protein